jgi:DNA-binding protein HU-beta
MGKKVITKKVETPAPTETETAGAISKKDLVNAIAEKSEYTKEAVHDIATAVFEEIADTLSDGKEISIYKFGTFSVKDTEPRTGRNPATGETIEIPAGKRVSFKFSSFIKKSVKGVE